MQPGGVVGVGAIVLEHEVGPGPVRPQLQAGPDLVALHRVAPGEEAGGCGLPDQHLVLFLDDRDHLLADCARVRPRKQVDLVLGDELLVERGGGRRNAAVVVDLQPHLAAEQEEKPLKRP